MHLTERALRAYLDGELSSEQQTTTAGHLSACAACRSVLETLQARAAAVDQHLAVLAAQPAEAPQPAHLALTGFRAQHRYAERLERKQTMLQSLFTRRLRPLWAGVAAVLVLTAALSIAPVRTWAGEFLGLFRVKQISVLPIDLSTLDALNNDSALADKISQLMSDSVTMTEKPGAPQTVADTAAASAAAGFKVRALGDRQAARIQVEGSSAFKAVINRTRAQAILDTAGHSDLQLPATIDGAVITVDIPAAVAVAYGNCPDDPEAMTEGAGTNQAPPEWQVYRDCTLLMQVPSPTVTTPPDLDMAQLAEIGLQLTGMSPAEARSFSQSVDWESTLVVPIPRNGNQYEQVEIDGTVGNLITRPGDDVVPARYTLFWVKDGIVYDLSGFGTSQDAVSLANSIR